MVRFGLCVLAWFALSAPAAAKWLRAESPNFIVYSERKEADLRDQVAELEDFDQLLRALTGAKEPPSANKLKVYLVRNTSELREVVPGISMYVAGFYSAAPTGIAVFVDTKADMNNRPGDDSLQVLFHEYAHHFMKQYFPAAYPAWYIEGFAEFMMNTRIDGRLIEYGGVSSARGAGLIAGNSWEPTEQILFDPDKVNSFSFYAQSWIMVHYLFRDPKRRQDLIEYLTAYGRGEDPRKAFAAAFETTPALLGTAVRRYAQGDGIPVTRITRASAVQAPTIAITPTSESADDILLTEAALVRGVAERYRPSMLSRARKAAERYPDDAYARRVYARAQIFYGDPAAAEPLLDGLIAAFPSDAELLYLRGMRYLVPARKLENPAYELRKAKNWFSKAHAADRNYYPTLQAYAESLRLEPNYVSENTANVLLLAHQLAPQVATIQMDAAVMQIRLDKLQAAQALLTPLSADPHNNKAAVSAGKLLEALKAGRRPDDAAISEAVAAVAKEEE